MAFMGFGIYGFGVQGLVLRHVLLKARKRLVFGCLCLVRFGLVHVHTCIHYIVGVCVLLFLYLSIHIYIYIYIHTYICINTHSKFSRCVQVVTPSAPEFQLPGNHRGCYDIPALYMKLRCVDFLYS